jgi:hypothetical protein
MGGRLFRLSMTISKIQLLDITHNKFREVKNNAEIFTACLCTVFKKWGKKGDGAGKF